MAKYELIPVWCVDDEWYWETYSDVKDANREPSHHYLEYGIKEMRKPSPFFDPIWYSQFLPYPDIEPLSHYLLFGHELGFEPCENFFNIIKSWILLNELELNHPYLKLTNHLEVSDDPRSLYERVLKSPYYYSIKSFYFLYHIKLSQLVTKNPIQIDDYTININENNYNVIENDKHNKKSNPREPKSKISVVYILPISKDYIPHFHMWLYSFNRFVAGCNFDLIIILKDINNYNDTKKCISEALDTFPELVKLNPNELIVHDNLGYDIASYIKFSKDHEDIYDYSLFMSTYSIILSDNWLIKFTHLIEDKTISLIGASGSDLNIVDFSLPSPNVHIRTAVFMVRLSDMNKEEFGSVYNKPTGWEFEHGRLSLSRRMAKKGSIGIVGKDGRFYGPRMWRQSNISPAVMFGNDLIIDHRMYASRLSRQHEEFLLAHPKKKNQWYDK